MKLQLLDASKIVIVTFIFLLIVIVLFSKSTQSQVKPNTSDVLIPV